ncbi:hypothetical protein ABZ618_31600 [Streptomyces roseolus]|uniref:hypothetical protein n=1 Tax=Streptomyces roseolus TaxID=67358 RepID=UPI0033F461D4
MTRTTPPRPVAVEVLFPKLAAFRGVATRLHPRPGRPDASVSSVGGPLLWPAGELWPVCAEPHKRGSGYRVADIRRERQVLADAWARDRPDDEERALLPARAGRGGGRGRSCQGFLAPRQGWGGCAG